METLTYNSETYKSFCSVANANRHLQIDSAFMDKWAATEEDEKTRLLIEATVRIISVRERPLWALFQGTEPGVAKATAILAIDPPVYPDQEFTQIGSGGSSVRYRRKERLDYWNPQVVGLLDLAAGALGTEFGPTDTITGQTASFDGYFNPELF